MFKNLKNIEGMLDQSLVVAVKQRIWGGWMLHNTGNIILTTPAIMSIVEFSCTSILEQLTVI